MEFVIAAVLVVLLFLAGILLFRPFYTGIESESRRAGRLGEAFAVQIIKEILREDDILLTNVRVSFEGKETELDNIIVNRHGVFIIEVKNYSGVLFGEEDDFEWIKTKTSESGQFYQKIVKNPIKQVKRQIYILSNHLRSHGIRVWIEGYAFLIEMNSPVDSEYILKNQYDIDTAIHHGRDEMLSESTINSIVELLV